MARVDPVALAADLIRCRSVTPDEGGALALLERVLAASGFVVERPVFSEAGTPDVENLFAHIGAGKPHLVFAGHTDVVPPGDERAWTHPPFAGELAEGLLYGRGATDMKGAIACFVAAVLDFLAGGQRPPGAISLLITGDEEGPAVNGTPKLLRWAAERGVTFDHCVVGEPTNAQVLGDTIKIGRRGSVNGTLVVDGTAGHVAYPQRADNPIPNLVRLMDRLITKPLDNGTEHFDRSNLEFTSVDVGNLTTNVIPALARARFNIRHNDMHTPTSIRAWIEQRCAEVAEGRMRWRLFLDLSNSPAFLTPPGEFTTMMANVVEEITAIRPELSTTGGTSDARFIKDYCPVVEFGLVGRTMHQTDEHVPVADLRALTAVYRRLLDRYFEMPLSNRRP